MKVAPFLFAATLAWATAALADPAAGDVSRGADVFKAQCAACHRSKAGETSPPIGPQLLGVVGRKAGSWDHFPYTASMRKAGFVWNAKLLDEYLENPYALVPGAAMGLLVPSPTQRADVIAFLSSAPAALQQAERP